MSPEETAERAIRMTLAGVTEDQVIGLTTPNIPMQHDPDRIARAMLTVYRAWNEPQYEALRALSVRRKGRTKLALANAMGVCRRKGHDGVREAHDLLQDVYIDLRASGAMRSREAEKVQA
ncbi:hypothetical protein ASF59_20175 [Methylobacterium sp. Leaf121]|jgi:hypothetical protein|nr:hypothetical protein ASF59_20175 [Methylobacterium sp. Leaf121]USU31518.1 hypothetical protein NG677_19685 [Methylobacterium sp. OTU13CASTA1]